MRVARRPALVGTGLVLVVAALGAAALCRPQPPAFDAVATPAPPVAAVPDADPQDRIAAGQPAPQPPASPAPPPPSAIGDDRSFTAAQDTWLRPGRYVWRPDRAGPGPVGIVVDLGRQMAYVYRAGTLIGVTTVSSGRRHHETPVGTFPILEKAVWHRSTLYSGAPMPYMQRLTWGGVALHAGGVPGYRQSHGCIHLPPAFARSLYRATTIGAEVRVVHRFDDRPPLLAPVQYAARSAFPTTAQSAAAIIAAAL